MCCHFKFGEIAALSDRFYVVLDGCCYIAYRLFCIRSGECVPLKGREVMFAFGLHHRVISNKSVVFDAFKKKYGCKIRGDRLYFDSVVKG